MVRERYGKYVTKYQIWPKTTVKRVASVAVAQCYLLLHISFIIVMLSALTSSIFHTTKN